jgi:REP element-mobilizing transposase RayT
VVFHPDRLPRRSIRLQEYDYTNEGAYFVTICTHQREPLFGAIADGDVILTQIGAIVDECWSAIPDHFPAVELDAYVVMPNHLHGIVIITQHAANVGARHAVPLQSRPEPTPVQAFGKPISGSLPMIVRSFKSAAARLVNISRDTPSAPLWQRNYYEHIIRNENDLNRIRAYIENNPSTWETDSENPNVAGKKP